MGTPAAGRSSAEPVVFAPLDFIARLAALVPRPRTHLLTYHGVLAPASEWRDWIVPAEPRSAHRDPSRTLAQPSAGESTRADASAPIAWGSRPVAIARSRCLQSARLY